MEAKERILISGYYGFDNSGDDAILKAIVKDLRENSENIEIVALSNKPSHTKRIYGIEAINRFKMREVRRAIKSCDLFISGGGSLLQDVTSTRSILYYLLLMNLAKRHKKPVMVYANGIGPINKKFNRFLTKRILNKVDLITLRDEDSKKFLEQLGVKNTNIHVTADPVFTLIPSTEERISEIFEIENIPLERPMIGISVRQWKNNDELVSTIAKTIDYILGSYDVNVLLIPMHYPEDLDISMKIKENVNRGNCYLLKEMYSVEDIMGIIKKMELIIAMRLHSLIYAATQGTPMIGLIYDPKIEGFLKFIDMEYMCHIEDIELVELYTDIDNVWKNKDNIRRNLMKKDEKLKEKALKNVKMALDLVEEGGKNG